jgi:hypothetical protein
MAHVAHRGNGVPAFGAFGPRERSGGGGGTEPPDPFPAPGGGGGGRFDMASMLRRPPGKWCVGLKTSDHPPETKGAPIVFRLTCASAADPPAPSLLRPHCPTSTPKASLGSTSSQLNATRMAMTCAGGTRVALAFRTAGGSTIVGNSARYPVFAGPAERRSDAVDSRRIPGSVGSGSHR